MKKIRLLAILNFLFFVVSFSTSTLSQFKVFNNQDNSQISAKYDTLFTPAGITFSIWGIIYISLFAFVIFHLIKAFKQNENSEANVSTQKMGYLFILNNLATTLWVFAFSFEKLGLSLLLIVLQLLTLLKINIDLKIYDPYKSLSSRILTQLPLSIYFGWICIATIANFSLYLVSIGWNGGFSAINWANILIWASLALSIFMTLHKKNPYFGLVVMWALYGIQLKLKSVDASSFYSLILSIWVAFAIVGFTTLIRFIINYKNRSYVETHKELV
jgi:hypothetical protein